MEIFYSLTCDTANMFTLYLGFLYGIMQQSSLILLFSEASMDMNPSFH